MKAILVIDEMPTKCIKCSQYAFECCHAMKREIERENIVQCKRPSWCPLKPMPKKTGQKPYCRTKQECVNLGWDACIDVITGETE